MEGEANIRKWTECRAFGGGKWGIVREHRNGPSRDEMEKELEAKSRSTGVDAIRREQRIRKIEKGAKKELSDLSYPGKQTVAR